MPLDSKVQNTKKSVLGNADGKETLNLPGSLVSHKYSYTEVPVSRNKYYDANSIVRDFEQNYPRNFTPDAVRIVHDNFKHYHDRLQHTEHRQETSDMALLDCYIGSKLKNIFDKSGHEDIWNSICDGKLAVSGSILLKLLDHMPNQRSNNNLQESDIDLYPTYGTDTEVVCATRRIWSHGLGGQELDTYMSKATKLRTEGNHETNTFFIRECNNGRKHGIVFSVCQKEQLCLKVNSHGRATLTPKLPQPIDADGDAEAEINDVIPRNDNNDDEDQTNDSESDSDSERIENTLQNAPESSDGDEEEEHGEEEHEEEEEEGEEENGTDNEENERHLEDNESSSEESQDEEDDESINSDSDDDSVDSRIMDERIDRRNMAMREGVNNRRILSTTKAGASKLREINKLRKMFKSEFVLQNLGDVSSILDTRVERDVTLENFDSTLQTAAHKVFRDFVDDVAYDINDVVFMRDTSPYQEQFWVAEINIPHEDTEENLPSKFQYVHIPVMKAMKGFDFGFLSSFYSAGKLVILNPTAFVYKTCFYNPRNALTKKRASKYLLRGYKLFSLGDNVSSNCISFRRKEETFEQDFLLLLPLGTTLDWDPKNGLTYRVPGLFGIAQDYLVHLGYFDKVEDIFARILTDKTYASKWHLVMLACLIFSSFALLKLFF